MPSIASVRSLRSSDSSLSSCSDFSVDTNFSDRGYVVYSSTDSSQEDFSSLIVCPEGPNLPIKLNGFHQIGNLVNHENGRSTKFDNSMNVEITQPQEDKDCKATVFLNDEVDAEFWLPPEPECQEDDFMGGVENYDDDDDVCGDGATWVKPSCLSSFGEESSGRYKFKHEKLKALNDVRNGRFRALVGQLVKAVGVDSSGINGENWVDIVTSLSWEAASFVKPDAHEDKAMDPDGCVKVKCAASGLRRQSKVIKGLVFKKHAAHKHMPTTYQNPRLLLIHGSLDLSSGGLLSFESMEQEKDNLKSIIEMIEMCHPNVVLVEKTVSRDIQESILVKGMTLVFDMKLHRLERVARCIGSPVLLPGLALGQRLRQCDSFHITKFMEEHAVSGESGKKQHKTLMFLEGCPNRLGCTILLMGANSDELKRIKCVVRCAVVKAYHLMLETSFLSDQSAMFCSTSPGEVIDMTLISKQSASVGSDSGWDSNSAENIPISNGFQQIGQQHFSEGNSSLSFQSYGPATFPGVSLSTSIQEVMNDNYPLISDCTDNMPSELGFHGRNQNNHAKNDSRISNGQVLVVNHDDKPKFGYEYDNLLNNEESLQPDPSYAWDCDDCADDHVLIKDDINTVLDSESILVLVSSQNASRGSVCEQSHFSHIKFYRSFDVPLGKFLRDNLLNQRLECKTCRESPEVHFFHYAHHNKQLTIQVRQLPAGKSLPGETEGRLWMWSRCSRCKFQEGISKSTKRILMSTAACGLSFGKFLELSFSNHSPFGNSSSCGHSFQKDFLYFFGLGPMVAMFKYSPVAIYTVTLPPRKMDFNSSLRGEFMKKDSENVYRNGISMFLDIEKSLKEIEARYVGVTLNIQGSSKTFPDVVEMLKQEKSRFEVDIQNALMDDGNHDVACKVLCLNRIRLELLLESCIWDRRIHALLSSNLKVIDVIDTDSISSQAQENPLQENGTAELEFPEATIATVICDGALEAASIEAYKFPKMELLTDGDGESRGQNPWSVSVVENGNARLPFEEFSENRLVSRAVEPRSDDHSNDAERNTLQQNFDSSVELQKDKTISIHSDDQVVDTHSLRGKCHLSLLSDLENDKGWIWAPFTEIRREYMEDLQRGYLPKIESFGSYSAESVAQKLIIDEGSRLHLPLGSNDYIVSDYEDEFSSIIACALTLLKDAMVATEDLPRDAKWNDSSQNLIRVFSFTSNWSSFGSSDSDSVHSPRTILEDSRSSSFDGLDLLDSLVVSYGASHPEVSMGSGKYPAKRKYSVVCLYAAQFRQLRDWFCPSEIDYIASLSRCRNWDAKGGKSKSFFAKTLDDRFIIKGIKRAEFDSFMKFATNYFDYMNQCNELGNQTCLAKILGIYQVVIRGNRSGKESRHDLVVMENLSFNQNVSRQYDLKGALHARFSTASNDPEDVLLDQNFVNDMNESPLYVSRKSKRNLQRAIYNDTNFLNSINVMDYSLLVGVDSQRQELACGIIDYLRQYTWDKQLENWVKSSLVVPKNQLPTIISPKEYKKRFRKFINTYFLSVPDHWCSQRSSNPCKLCGPCVENGPIHRKP